MNNQASNSSRQVVSKKSWIILDNGKRYYIRATIFDIVIALLFPFFGLIAGLFAIIKKEYKRGWTMVAISLIVSIIIIVLSVSR